MKRNWRNRFIVACYELRDTSISGLVLRTSYFVLIIALLVLSACKSKDSAHEHDTYTCPMHPTITSDRPGTCPVCGMELVRKTRPGEEVQITEDLAKLIKSPNEVVVASIKTVKGEYKSMPVAIEAQGVVTYDTRAIYTIPSRIGGRLEKVFLKYPFQPVRKGQKVAEIYSPELLTAQRELIFLLENDSENTALIQSAKERLRLLGASENQISNLIQNKEPQNTFAIYSPYDGYVISETQQTPVAPMTSQPSASTEVGMNDGMGATSGSAPRPGSGFSTESSAGVLIREGSYVTSGQTLFKVVNPSALRIELNIATAATGAITRGGEVILDFGTGDQQSATIDFVQPFFNEGQEFLTVRVYTKNAEKLHIGHLVKAIVKSTPVEALWVPKEAVLDLGIDKVVFVKEREVLKPKKVVTGARTDNAIEIKQGLSSSDEIAANAQYLVDSESFIKPQK